MSHPHFPHIFSPLTINRLTISNRICSTAHYAEWMSDDEGLPNADYIAYMQERAKGGIGLLTVGATATTRDGGPIYLRNLDDRFVDGYRRLADAVHAYDTKIIAQLIHVGDQAAVAVGRAGARIRLGEHLPVLPAASWVEPPPAPQPMRDWSVRDLYEIAESFGRAASRAKAGGMDGVELHAHERYLHAQFLSPVYNRRTDEYGGGLENRARLAIRTLAAMRRETGDDFVVGVRLKARDFHREGMVEEDCIRLIQLLEREKLIDYVSLTAGTDQVHHGPMYLPDGDLLAIVGGVRREIGVPVVHAGRITGPRMAEQALADGHVDVVGMTKAHIADPHLVRKLREGRLEDIRPCIRCLHCLEIDAVTCLHNPATGREREFGGMVATKRPRRVLVIGAGPAGMEAAITAARRGHDVSVLEKSAEIGGQVRFAGAGRLRRKFLEITDYHSRQAEKHAVEVCLNSEAEMEMVLRSSPDIVMFAAGSRHLRTQVEGMPRDAVLTVPEAISSLRNATGRYLIVDRVGRANAFVAADVLSSGGADVVFVAAMDRAGPYLGDRDGGVLYQNLADRGVSFLVGYDVARVDGGDVILRDMSSGEETVVGRFDAIVAECGETPAAGLSVEIRAAGLEVRIVGSAAGGATIAEATLSGARAGMQI